MENQDGFHVPPEFAAELLRMLLEQEQATARPSWLTAREYIGCADGWTTEDREIAAGGCSAS